jgi:hypothetical protein
MGIKTISRLEPLQVDGEQYELLKDSVCKYYKRNSACRGLKNFGYIESSQEEKKEKQKEEVKKPADK